MMFFFPILLNQMLMMLESILRVCFSFHLLSWDGDLSVSDASFWIWAGDFFSSERKSRFMKWLSKLFKGGSSHGGGARYPQFLGDGNMVCHGPSNSCITVKLLSLICSVNSGCLLTVVSLSVLHFTRDAIQFMTSKFYENSQVTCQRARALHTQNIRSLFHAITILSGHAKLRF